MRIAVLGTGMVGQALAGRLDSLSHDVTIGTRDPRTSLARSEPADTGTPPLAAWLADHPRVRLDTFRAATDGVDLVVNATSGSVAQAVLEQAGADHLAGTIVIDISNPLDFSAGMPPTLFVKDTDSLGERIQAAFPQAKVVKTLNTLSAPLMVDPAALGKESTVFVSGNDADAKATVTALLASFGHTDIVDLGDISTARGTEMFLPLWLRLWGALGTPMMNIKVVR